MEHTRCSLTCLVIDIFGSRGLVTASAQCGLAICFQKHHTKSTTAYYIINLSEQKLGVTFGTHHEKYVEHTQRAGIAAIGITEQTTLNLDFVCVTNSKDR